MLVPLASFAFSSGSKVRSAGIFIPQSSIFMDPRHVGYVWNSSHNKLYSILNVCRSTWMNMIALTSLNLYRIIYRNDRKFLKTFECTKKSRCSMKTLYSEKSHFLSLAKIPFLVLVGKIRFFLSSFSSAWLSVSTWPSSVLFFLPILITRFFRAWIYQFDGLQAENYRCITGN